MKRKLFFLGASLLTGVVGTALLHRKKINENTVHLFAGDWFYRRRNNEKVHLTVTPALDLYIQNKQQPVTIIDQTPYRLIFLDSMGYHITFEKKDEILFFLDEAEDISFELIKK